MLIRVYIDVKDAINQALGAGNAVLVFFADQGGENLVVSVGFLCAMIQFLEVYFF